MAGTNFPTGVKVEDFRALQSEFAIDDNNGSIKGEVDASDTFTVLQDVGGLKAGTRVSADSEILRDAVAAVAAGRKLEEGPGEMDRREFTARAIGDGSMA